MRLFVASPKRPHSTIPGYVMLCLGALTACGGKRFQSQTDAGAETFVSSETTAPSPSSGVASTTPVTHVTATIEPAGCDGGTCDDTLAPTDGGANSPSESASSATFPVNDAALPGDSTTDELTDESTTFDSTTQSSCTPSDSCEASSNQPALTSSATTTVPSSSTIATSAPLDECPDILDQELRGACGCGFEPTQSCETLATHLVHRYTFDGEGKQLADVVGEAHGHIHDCELAGTGQLEFDGEGCYVDLPEGIISKYDAVTFEMWVRWDGGERNQRIFNFGTQGESGDAPSSFVSLSPRSGDDDALTLSYRADPDDSSDTLRADDALSVGDVEHVAVVVDSDQGRLSLYLWGELLTSMDTDQTLTELEDRRVWLGRALYDDYPFLSGALLEFRIYDTALGSEELAQSVTLGLDAPHLWPRAL